MPADIDGSLDSMSNPNLLTIGQRCASDFSKFPGMYNICHLNVRSLCDETKISEFRKIFYDSNVHTIAVTETWFKQKDNSLKVKLPNYNLLRNDRFMKRGGGVALYFRQDIPTRVVSKSSKRSEVEYMFAEAIFLNTTVLVGVVYIPPKTTNLTVLEESLAALIPVYDHVVLSGDFNINLLCKTPIRDRFLNMISCLNLTTISNKPTHFTNTNSSLIDYFITNNEHNIK